MTESLNRAEPGTDLSCLTDSWSNVWAGPDREQVPDDGQVFPLVATQRTRRETTGAGQLAVSASMAPHSAAGTSKTHQL